MPDHSNPAWNRLAARALAIAGACAVAVPVAFAAPGDKASVAMKSAEGADLGQVMLEETPHGVLLHADLHGLPEGTHAFHVHAVGACEPPFKSAGGHFNPSGAAHGLMSAAGPHAGDMPNIHVGSAGTLNVEIFNSWLAIDDKLFDDDGAAIVIHEGGDDYKSYPAGAAGPRIACGVITK
ncbi:superoxide dismutase family protein [Oceanibacterium hippocampi]|uniref:Superoxide dismutase [Cu-Zn] n=1 Tax=Oceanibacterium hippocampi TaxID=745714 RepID=A0A1Y5TX07_9PROT|nr:superoxide dismutase family protein [Oceanibacterium hippocampi]SLN75784.1 Superoxide dismutase [Cu-Zn] precursor [Oceanibacterium hippocampi]